MDYVKAFLVGGSLCVIAQLLIDYTKLTPAKILVTYVVLGVLLGGIGIYQPLVDFAGAGASVPLLGFGNTLAKGIRTAVAEYGFLGIFTGGFTAAAAVSGCSCCTSACTSMVSGATVITGSIVGLRTGISAAVSSSCASMIAARWRESSLLSLFVRMLRSTMLPTCHALTTATHAHSAMATRRRCSRLTFFAVANKKLPAAPSRTTNPSAACVSSRESLSFSFTALSVFRWDSGFSVCSCSWFFSDSIICSSGSLCSLRLRRGAFSCMGCSTDVSC